ncbi:MAG: hypothetical protein V1843_05120 [bacterium]
MDEEQIVIEQKMEKRLDKFWKKYGRTLFVKARHTDLTVQPRMLVGHEINPEVLRRLIEAYLAKLTPSKILNGEVEFTGETIIIKTKDGKKLLEVTSQRIINNMRNVITSRVGMLLSATERSPKVAYIEAKEGARYSFGDIRDAVKLYLAENGKEITGSFLVDALLLLDKDKPTDNISFSTN